MQPNPTHLYPQNAFALQLSHQTTCWQLCILLVLLQTLWVYNGPSILHYLPAYHALDGILDSFSIHCVRKVLNLENVRWNVSGTEHCPYSVADLGEQWCPEDGVISHFDEEQHLLILVNWASLPDGDKILKLGKLLNNIIYLG